MSLRTPTKLQMLGFVPQPNVRGTSRAITVILVSAQYIGKNFRIIPQVVTMYKISIFLITVALLFSVTGCREFIASNLCSFAKEPKICFQYAGAEYQAPYEKSKAEKDAISNCQRGYEYSSDPKKQAATKSSQDSCIRGYGFSP